MNKIFSFFLLAFLYSTGLTYGQNTMYTDSLNRVIHSSNSEEVKAANYILLGKAYFQMDFKKAIDFLDQAIKIGYKYNIVSGIADGYNNKGFAYINMGESMKALSCLDSALMYHERIGNKQGVASVLANYGNLYYAIGEYAKSLEYQLLCLKKREELNDKTGQGQTYNGIANIYLSQRDYDKALMWYKRCLDINRSAKNKTVEVSALCNIGTVLTRQSKLDEAYEVYKEAISIATSVNNKDGLAASYMGLSRIDIKNGRKNEALVHIKKAEKLFMETGNAYKVNDVKGKIGDIYSSMGDYKKAIEYYDLYVEFGKKMGMKKVVSDGLELLSECYSQLNNSEKAYQYLSEYSRMNDSMQKDEKIKQLAEMQVKFETERKERDNVILAGKLKVQSLELSNSRYLMAGLGVLFFLSVVIALLVVRQNKLKSQQTAIQLEQKLLRSQMNPHFIFNSLTTIESFIYENQPREAGKFLSDFARLMRLILENSSEEYIPLTKEIKTLEYYLVLQKLRLEDKLTYSIKTNGIEDMEGINIPPMLTQPFIENAIEHGFKGTNREGHIELEFKIIDNDILKIRVTDNGKGINNSLQENYESGSKHKSMAVQITKERLMVLNKTKKQKVTFSISDISDESSKSTGTRVEFTIPVV